MSDEELIQCRMNARITLAQCRKRQLGFSFYRPRRTDPKFMSCAACQHFLSDEEYEEGTKDRKSSSHFNIPSRKSRD